MAAYAALVSLSRLTNQILYQDQDYAFLCNKEQMESLHEKVIRLQEFLEHISVRYRSSITLDELESRIRNVASKLDYIMESVICKLVPQPANSFSCLLASSMSCIGRNSNKGEAGSNLAAVYSSCIDEVNILLEETTDVKNKPVKKYVSPALHSSTTNSSMPIAVVANVGLNEEIAEILDTVTSHVSNLQIVPITGMGGIGKTTLARAVYDDSRLLHHFDVRLWVTISQEYDVQEVLRRLLPTEQQTQPGDGLIEQVYKKLKGRRFLIVLDDIWEGKAWDGVMNAFPDDNNRSRVILTTRLLRVASYIGCLSNVHEMQLLNENQSWVMLREKVYGREPCPIELDEIGRTISRNCKGLPLTIVVIAGLLKRNKIKDYWEEVAKNTKAASATDYDQLLGILSLSYTNLPPQLKACFLHVGAFPEDYEFQVKELVMLWTAEGFIKPRESKTKEDIAEECIEELVERSLFLVKKKTYNSKIKSFSIHDVLREVSMKKAKEEKFLQQNSTSTVQNSINNRYKVSSLKNDLNFNSGTYNARLRSFKYTIHTGSEWEAKYYALPGKKIDKVICFRHDSTLNINYTPRSILCKTTSLRFLYVVNDIYEYDERDITFPESISNLQNLEAFITRNERANGFITIPLDIWKLPRLRHIVVDEYCKLQFPAANERGYPILENLQTVIGVINAEFSMDVIERIPNVKRMKLIYGRNHPQKLFSLNNLQHLHQLEELSIERDVIKLFDFSFPRNLKKLSLYNTQVASSIIGSLPYLEVLKLNGWSSVDGIWEPVEGEFLELKYLNMKNLFIQEWRVESFHFPCLQRLEISRCRSLKEVPECVGEIVTLEELVLNDCRLAKESVQKIQDNQQAFGNDSLKITIIYCG